MRSALILAFLLGSASAKGYNRSRTKLAIPKQDVGRGPTSNPNRGPTARIVGGAPPLTMRAPCVGGLTGGRIDVSVTSSGPLSTRSHAQLLRRRSCHAVRAQLGPGVSSGRLCVRRLAHRRAVGHYRSALHPRHPCRKHAGRRAPPRSRVGRQRRARLRRDCGYRREVRASRVQ